MPFPRHDSWGGVRTHEAYAADLKSAPFNHSGTQLDATFGKSWRNPSSTKEGVRGIVVPLMTLLGGLEPPTTRLKVVRSTGWATAVISWPYQTHTHILPTYIQSSNYFFYDFYTQHHHTSYRSYVPIQNVFASVNRILQLAMGGYVVCSALSFVW